MMRFAATAAVVLCVSAGSFAAKKTPAVRPSAPAVFDREERRTIAEGVEHIQRQTSVPLNINVLLVRVGDGKVGVRPCMSLDLAVGVEALSSMTTRTGSIAGISGDHWGVYGIPSGMTMINGELITPPRYRSVFAVRRDGSPFIGKFTDTLMWKAKVIAPNGKMRDISSLNQECNEDWLTLYTERFGILAGGNKFPQTTAVVLDEKRRVKEVRLNQEGVRVSPLGNVLVGRDTASDWLQANVKLGDELKLDLQTTPRWQDYLHAIGGGPELLRNGAYWAESLEGYPAGEDFDAKWKKQHLSGREARAIVGHSRDKQTVILMTIDGDQPGVTVGATPEEAAMLVREFGGWNAMFLGGDASTVMTVGERVVNSIPSRGKNQRVEPQVSNALLVVPSAAKQSVLQTSSGTSTP